MFAVILDVEKTLLLEATSVLVSENNDCVKFFDIYDNLIALFKLNEIKGFYQMD